MLELTKHIIQKISPITPKVFPEPTKCDVFPYVEFTFPNVDSISNSTDGILLVFDIWDAERTNYDVFAEIERLTSKIDNLFRDEHYATSEYHYMFQRVGKRSITDPNTTIRRRQITYLVKAIKL